MRNNCDVDGRFLEALQIFQDSDANFVGKTSLVVKIVAVTITTSLTTATVTGYQRVRPHNDRIPLKYHFCTI